MKQDKRKGGRLTVPMVIALVVALGLAAAGVIVYQTVRSTGSAQRVVTDYFTALEDRRFDDAHRMLCSDTRSSHPREAFESTVRARPPSGHELTGELRVNRTLRRTTGTVGVSVTYADGTSDARMISLVREEGDWLVCGSPY